MSLAVAVAIGGCGTGRSGVLTGHIYRLAGLSGPSDPAVGGLVTVFAQTGRAVAHERVHDGQAFHFVLPGGEYTLLVRHACGNGTDTLVKRCKTTVVDIDEVCGIP